MPYTNHFTELPRHEPNPDVEKRARAWLWTKTNCNGIDNIGTCPICGERVQVQGGSITDNGRLIGSCGDAFTIEQWEAP